MKTLLKVIGTLIIAWLLLIFVSVLIFSNLHSDNTPYQLQGSAEERSAKLAAILERSISTEYETKSQGNSNILSKKPIKKTIALPGHVYDAHYFWDTNNFLGDGPMYYTFRVPLQSIPEWLSLLKKIDSSKQLKYAAPRIEQRWWLTKDRFAKLIFFDPLKLTGFSYGWCAVDVHTGQFYIYAVAM